MKGIVSLLTVWFVASFGVLIIYWVYGIDFEYVLSAYYIGVFVSYIIAIIASIIKDYDGELDD